jgi:hypothetical protein
MAEAVTAMGVVGLIGSIISITEAITEVYKLATEAQQLPQAFSVINDRIPVVQKTLRLAQGAYNGTPDEPAIHGSLVTCEENVGALKYIFDKVCIVGGETTVGRYKKAINALKPGRGGKVEKLFKDILETLQTLQTYHVFRNLPMEEVVAATADIESVDPSITDDHVPTINSSGQGAVVQTGCGTVNQKWQVGNGGYMADTMNFGTLPGTKQ